jgi:hypothetical protein
MAVPPGVRVGYLKWGFTKEGSVMRKLFLALTAVGLLAGSVPTLAAAPCRDAKGKFVKCAKKATAKPAKCRDAKGHYAKCGTPGAKPA